MSWFNSTPPRWQTARDAKAAATQHAFDQFQTRTPEKTLQDDLPYLSASAAEIVESIAQGRWTAVRVLEAYIRQTVRTHRVSNHITETNFEEALNHAASLDAAFKKTGELVGSLHGVPVSVKDQFDMPGLDSSLGFSDRVNQPKSKDALLVQFLKAAGAVPFVKTNVPQTLLAFESSNPVFGKTLNPYDPGRTAGGSSSGEGVSLGSDASALGLGTDIGGSVRIPAHYSGCVSLKVSYGRFTLGGIASANPGFESVLASPGLMGRRVSDLTLLAKVLFDGSADPSIAQIDPKIVLPLPFRSIQLPARLKFGYYLRDNLFLTSPACQRAVLETVAALRAAGHEVVELDPPDAVRVMQIFVALTSSDGYEGLLSNLHGDPPEPFLFLVNLQKRLGPTVLKWLSRLLPGDDKLFGITASAGAKSAGQLKAWHVARDSFVAALRRQLWGDLKLDGVIAPVQAVPALRHGETWNVQFLAAGTILWNVVESAVGVIPVTRVDRDKDRLTQTWRESTSDYSPRLHQFLYGSSTSQGGLYDADAMHGLPVGVQVVGPMFSEEKVLRLLDVVESALGDTTFGPGRFARQSAELNAPNSPST